MAAAHGCSLADSARLQSSSGARGGWLGEVGEKGQQAFRWSERAGGWAWTGSVCIQGPLGSFTAHPCLSPGSHMLLGAAVGGCSLCSKHSDMPGLNISSSWGRAEPLGWTLFCPSHTHSPSSDREPAPRFPLCSTLGLGLSLAGWRQWYSGGAVIPALRGQV